MGTEQDTVSQVWLIAGDDIGTAQVSTVIAFKSGLLRNDLHAEFLKLTDNPLLTKVVSLTVHGTGTEVALLLAVQKGTVGNEGGPHRSRRFHNGHTLPGATRGEEQNDN